MTANIGCPWNSTLVSAKTGSSCLPTGLTSFTGTSAATSTPTTPGAARTASRSIDTISACARSLSPR